MRLRQSVVRLVYTKGLAVILQEPLFQALTANQLAAPHGNSRQTGHSDDPSLDRFADMRFRTTQERSDFTDVEDF